MKKITQITKNLLLTLCLLPSLGLAQNPYQNIFIILDASGLPESTVVIEVEMQNYNPSSAIQFEIPLPSGFSYIAGSAFINPLRYVNHILNANTLPGTNILRVIVFSIWNTPFIGNTGIIVSFVLSTPIQSGNYQLNLDNCIIGCENGINCITGVINGVVSIMSNIPAYIGDSNCNGSVNVMDVITTVKYMLGNNPQSFCFDNADINGDGIVNVIDVIATINIILGLDSGFSD